MIKILKIIGVLLIVYSVFCGMVNLGLWHPWGIGDITALWNPLSLITPSLVGNIPFISDAIAWLVNGVFAVIWSIAMFIIGLILLK